MSVDIALLRSDAEAFDLPRSRLYRLAPIVGNAGRHESLLSYLVALAAAHSVSPRDLMRYEVAPDDFALLRGARQPGFNNQYASTVSGLGLYAQAFADRLNELTQREDLQSLTLLGLRELFATNGPKQMSSLRRWCPQCLVQSTEGRHYAPLLWSLELYSCCVIHGTPLVDRCPSCRRRQPFVPKLPTLQLCSHCHHYLFDSSIKAHTADMENNEHQWTSHALENLLAFCATFSGTGLLSRFHANLCHLIDCEAEGNRAVFCRRLGFSPGAFKNWLTKQQRPTLPQFLRLSWSVGLMPDELLATKVTGFGRVPGMSRRPASISSAATRPVRDLARHRQVERHLQDAGDSKVIEPMSAVCERLGVSRYVVRYRFPTLYALICNRWRVSRNEQLSQKRLTRLARIDSFVDALILEGIYPSRHRLENKMRTVGDSVRDPKAREHLKSRIKTRYEPTFENVHKSDVSELSDSASSKPVRKNTRSN